MWRDLAIALSLANLCFIHAWRLLLVPSSNNFYYHRRIPPPLVEYIALPLDVLLLAAVLFAGITLVRRSRKSWVRKAAKIVFILIVSVPLYGVLMQLDTPGVRRLILPFVSDEEVTQRVIVTIPLTICLFGLYVAFRRLDKSFRVAVTAILIMTPFVLITFVQTPLTAMKYAEVGDGITATPPAHEGARGGVRVLWLVFDEFDFRVAFAQRPATVRLGELDRLSSQSIFATNAYPPAGETFLSMPALITGRLVSEARRRGPDDLMIKFGDGTEAAPWSGQPTIFSRAREAGLNTALIGWYHPYCRILGSSLTRCAWESGDLPVFRVSREVTLDAPPSTGVRGVAAYMYEHFRKAALTIPLVNFMIPEVTDRTELRRKKHVANHEDTYRQAAEAATDPSLDVVMIHWQIPHYPNIYNRSEDRISVASNQGYLDNLELVDRTLGDIRRAMESNGTWDRTAVLITSDHWWRAGSLWKKHRVLTAEDETIWGGVEDRRVPFILKMAGAGEAGVTFAAPFNTVLSHDLLLAILRGEVSDTNEAAAWLDQHRSIGRSPYDEREYR